MEATLRQIPVPGYQAKVVGENGNEVPRGEQGRLAVIGPTGCRYLDDPERGNIVKAYVVQRDEAEGTSETARELQDFAKKEIAPYKYPRSIEFIDDLPRTQSGKLQRFKLRERR